MTVISEVFGGQVFDSRGRPTVEVEVTLADGSQARAQVPSGASTGTNEALELRDGDAAFFEGLGVLTAVGHVNGEIAAAVRGRDVTDQQGCDAALRELDGTATLSRLGANAVLGTSLAVARASAAATRQPLYRRLAELAGVTDVTVPMPMVSILSGGQGMDIQDVLAVPVAAESIGEALHLVARVREAGTVLCRDRGIPTLLADEGGLSPGCRTGREALELMIATIEHAGLDAGRDIAIAIDVAAASLYDSANDVYDLAREGRKARREEMVETIASWVDDFPIVSIEDPLDEEDWEGWQLITERLGDRVQLVGDDLFTTNLGRLDRGVTSGCATSVLVKVNQNGTLSGTMEVLAAARAADYTPIVSARSGDTEDDLLADLAVGTAAGQIKVGSVRSSERLAKYNQLIRIAEDPSIPFAAFPSVSERSVVAPRE